MPTVSSDGRNISFKIFPHYFEDIKRGRKKADIRVLSDKWFNILKHAEFVEFTSESGQGTLFGVISGYEEIQNQSIIKDIACLFTDININDTKGKEDHLVIIKFENAKRIDL